MGFMAFSQGGISEAVVSVVLVVTSMVVGEVAAKVCITSCRRAVLRRSRCVEVENAPKMPPTSVQMIETRTSVESFGESSILIGVQALLRLHTFANSFQTLALEQNTLALELELLLLDLQFRARQGFISRRGIER